MSQLISAKRIRHLAWGLALVALAGQALNGAASHQPAA